MGEMMTSVLLSKSSVDCGYVARGVQESKDSAVRKALLERAGLDHDGLDIWKRIIEWAQS